MSGGRAVPRGQWARIHRVELAPSERASDIPEDTAAVPFETWINGWLVDEASLGEPVRLRTPAGRVVEGVLVEVAPGYTHSFGSPPSALQLAGARAWARLFGEEQR
jgi:2-amino-4-ketopentanoate thiolase alpha subunit